MNINYFATENLFDAGRKFFQEELLINLSRVSVNLIPLDKFLAEQLKGNDAYLLNEISEAYFLGLVDDESLNDIFNKEANLEDEADKDSSKYEALMVFAIKLKSQDITRTDIAKITRAFNRRVVDKPVVLLSQCGKLLSFSTAERSNFANVKKQGEKVGKISMLKDIDIESIHAGHRQILLEMKINPKNIRTFEDLYKSWQKVFSVSLLNKKFFQELANWYFLSVAYSKFPYEYLKSDPKHKGKLKAELQEIANQKGTIRFITRMIFVWFLKEKGLISKDLFDKDKISKLLNKFNTKNSTNYYNAILQNLFFATLNKTKTNRGFALNKSFKENQSNYDLNSLYRYENMFQDENPKNIMKLFEKIPFLNGGLFDSLDTKPDIKNSIKEEIIDGFSRNEKWQAKMPDFLFFEEQEIDFDEELRLIYDTKNGQYHVRGLFAIFKQYKFTIEENTATEVDVALDPYLLGEIFENLLAYYNPETGTTARKGTGSFYTPQEIVNYMVEESLTSYLDTKLKNHHLKVAEFDKTNELPDDKKIQIVKALSEVKILDPACGSGAFPMGVLYKMVDMLKHIDPKNTIWRQIQHDKIIGDKIKELEADKKAIAGLSDKEVKQKAINAVEERLIELETIFNNEYNFDDYARKLYIIQNCIYGVDIQDIAIQISKLRFFLSLIVDQKNDDIKPLPNLETKFVIANTLIGIDLPKFKLMGEDDHSQDTTKALKEELKHVREQHFKAITRKEKLAIKKQDKIIREKIANSLADNLNNFKQEDIDKLNNEITIQKKLLEEAELMPDMVQEKIVVDLFGGETTIKVNYRKERIKECKAQIKLNQNKIDNLQTNTQAELIRAQALKIAQWDIYNQNAQADWFDMDWMFGINEGFDIVIGNPPYVQVPKGIFSTTMFPFSEGKDKGKQNLYKVFVEASYNLLSDNGVATMIVQSSLMCDISSQFTRELLLTKTTIKEILEFPKKSKSKDGQVFDTVLQGTCIYNFTKRIPNKNHKFNVSIDNDITTIKKLKFEKLDQIELISIYPNGFFIPLVNSGEFKIIQKLNFKSKPFFNYIDEISQGDINLTAESRFFSKMNKTKTILLRGKHTHKYCIDYFSDEYIQDNYKSNITKLNKSISYFVCQQVTGTTDKYRLHFAITSMEKQFLFGNSVNKFNLKEKYLNNFVLALLNSNLLDWYFRKTSTNNHVNGYEIEYLPIFIPSAKVIAKFENIVLKIIDGKIAEINTTDLEHQIDALVYELYDLTEEEIKIIEGKEYLTFVEDENSDEIGESLQSFAPKVAKGFYAPIPSEFNISTTSRFGISTIFLETGGIINHKGKRKKPSKAQWEKLKGILNTSEIFTTPNISLNDNPTIHIRIVFGGKVIDENGLADEGAAKIFNWLDSIK